MKDKEKTNALKKAGYKTGFIKNKPLYYFGFVLLTALYIASAIVTAYLSRTTDVITIGRTTLPISTFVGVLSSLTNICVIFLVVFYKKLGFITALTALLMQFPLLVRNMLMQQSLSVLPGIFINLFAIIAVILIHTRNKKIEEFRTEEMTRLLESQQYSHKLFEQTAEALASAIDAKDTYTNGHSQRVADYSRKIARELGKSEEECEQIYFTALLHDVGKIGVPISILNKPGRLTDDEFSQIKLHPVVGGQILSSIQLSPYLSIGARYHHERYDGKGYPEGLKGDDIPEIARIIAVADSYDAMSSNRSYRRAIPQHMVREELVKGMGTQFDPEVAKAMIHCLDLDTEYRMREKESGGGLSPAAEMYCRSVYNECTEGIPVTCKAVRVDLAARPDDGHPESESMPVLLFFDSLDGRVHPGQENNKDLLYFEYARIRLDGRVEEKNVRCTKVSETEKSAPHKKTVSGREKRYSLEAVKYRDHVLVKIRCGGRESEIVIALPDSIRFVYMSVTGENCFVRDINVENSETEIGPDFIPRIAEEISYTAGCPVGDVPNVEVDGWCSDATEGIPVKDGMELTFHSMSLPTARLVWHCPYICLFSAKGGVFKGEDFREYLLLRLDGENWESDEHADNRVNVNRTVSFGGWNEWKEKNKQGIDCKASIKRQGDTISIETENLGLYVGSVTTIRDEQKDVFIALTGDQCAITDIRIKR